MTDPIADMLTRIRNGLMVKKREINFPYSKIKFEIAKILEREGYIQKISVIDIKKEIFIEENQPQSKFKQLKVILKYNKLGKPIIHNLKRVSTPGRRVYVKSNEVRPVLNGFGISILSTSQGLVTNKEAREKRLGGELLCKIY